MSHPTARRIALSLALLLAIELAACWYMIGG